MKEDKVTGVERSESRDRDWQEVVGELGLPQAVFLFERGQTGKQIDAASAINNSRLGRNAR